MIIDAVSRLSFVTATRVRTPGIAGEFGCDAVTAPAVELPPWYGFATNALLLLYIARGGERYTN